MSSETAINKDRFSSERREAAMSDKIMQNYNRLPGDMQPKDGSRDKEGSRSQVSGFRQETVAGSGFACCESTAKMPWSVIVLTVACTVLVFFLKPET
jgi:hypothetical protein